MSKGSKDLIIDGAAKEQQIFGTVPSTDCNIVIR